MGGISLQMLAAVEGSSLETLCKIAGTPLEYKKITGELFNSPFQETEVIKRKKILEGIYNNHENALRLMQWIW